MVVVGVGVGVGVGDILEDCLFFITNTKINKYTFHHDHLLIYNKLNNNLPK